MTQYARRYRADRIGAAQVENPDARLLELLVAHTDAWNSHDLDRLMSLFTDDCVFLAAGGDEACGKTFSGREAVEAEFAEIYENVPDAQWIEGRHSVLGGQRGVSQWRMIGTLRSGQRLEIEGCDFLAFRDDKIALKDSYTKDRHFPHD